jgi:hypothetical protein
MKTRRWFKKLLYAGMLFCALSGLQVAAQPKWQLVKDAHGIQVYTASTASSGFKSIKVNAVFEGTWQKLIAILLEVESQPQWVYGTRQAYLLKKVNNQEILYYVETELPWPAQNRDTIIRMRIHENRARNRLTITSVGEPQALAIQEKKVRVPHFKANWEVTMVGKDRISLSYLLDADPGGSLPAWIVNLFISKGPYETFRKLSELLKK